MSTIEMIVPPTNCNACAFTKRVLEKAGIDYRVTKAADLPAGVLEELRKHHRSFPVLRTPVGTFSGVMMLGAARDLAIALAKVEKAA